MKWIALALSLPFLALLGGLLGNRPPLLAPPGSLERLKTYLTTNVAETRPDHIFPELRPPLVAADAARTRAIAVGAMRSLGWQEIRDEGNGIGAVVVTPFLGFRDDVTLRLQETDAGTLVHARSASRIGKGDLGANARHLRDLFTELLTADGTGN